jgi:hypothetical protein
MGYKIGDLVVYNNDLYKVTLKHIAFDAYSENSYDLVGIVVSGFLLGIAESNLTPHSPMAEWSSPDYRLPVGSTSAANGCECGAWISTFKEDHMHFCPKFKGDV